MGGKKKGKKKGEEKPAQPPVFIIPDFTPKDLKPLPIYVKVKHFKEIYYIYTDEYSKGVDVKEKLSKVINKPVENIRLYLGNKRQIEDNSTHHDQQVNNTTTLYACYKTGEGKNDWDNFKEVINFDLNPPKPTEGENPEENQAQ